MDLNTFIVAVFSLIDDRVKDRPIQASERVPVVMLTARGEEEDRIVGLGIDADDCVVKPFSSR